MNKQEIQESIQRTEAAVTELTSVVKDIGQRQLAVENQVASLSESVQEEAARSTGSSVEEENGLSTVSSGDEEAGDLQEELADLRRKVEMFESQDFADELIRQWVRGLTPESYIALGVKLNFQDLLREEALQDPGTLEEVEVGEEGIEQVIFSDTVPEGETGWEKSESLNCFVKVKR